MVHIYYNTAANTVDIITGAGKMLLNQPVALGHAVEKLFTEDCLAYAVLNWAYVKLDANRPDLLKAN